MNAEVTEEETRYLKDFHTILAQEKAKHVRDMKLEKDRYSKLVKVRMISCQCFLPDSSF